MDGDTSATRPNRNSVIEHTATLLTDSTSRGLTDTNASKQAKKRNNNYNKYKEEQRKILARRNVEEASWDLGGHQEW
jgi:hypothetical protein